MIKDTIVVLQGDITEMNADAIVTAANTDLVMEAGVAGEIRKKGGPEIQAECYDLAPIEPGHVAVTNAGGLPARYVIHAAVMRLGQHATHDAVKAATYNALAEAGQLGCKTIAVPAVGTGADTGGMRLKACARDMMQAVYTYLKDNAGTTSLEEVAFVLYDKDAFNVFAAEHERLPAKEAAAV